MENSTKSTQTTKDNLKHKIESLLFTLGRSISVERIGKMLGESDKKKIIKELQELKKEYSERGGGVVLENVGEEWHLTVKPEYLEPIKRHITQTEFPKSLAETMAVIAWKAPILQSEIVEIRSNKAYDHIKRLEEMGFITKKKKGRTYEIELTKRFFEYFDVENQDELKKRLEKKA
jgi:segregation and condensation protein B